MAISKQKSKSTRRSAKTSGNKKPDCCGKLNEGDRFQARIAGECKVGAGSSR